MKYSKPEVTVLGDAARIIQCTGCSKPGFANDGHFFKTPTPAYDLDE